MAPHRIKSALLSRRTWTVSRQAFAWAKEGSIYIVRLIPNYLKRLHAANQDSIGVGERQFSLDDTPIFHFKLRNHNSSTKFKYLPSFLCITSAESDECDEVYHQNGRNNYFGRDEEECRDSDCEKHVQVNMKLDVTRDDEENIDSKAEEIIERVYEKMKLQRQVSYLQYIEMLSRGTS